MSQPGSSPATRPEARRPRSPAIAARDEAARHGWRVLGTLSLLMGFASISTDVYLPALPVIAPVTRHKRGLRWIGPFRGILSASAWVNFCGDLSATALGRRLPVALGLVLFVIGSAGCALSGDVWTMIGWRVAQAAGACAGVVLARAMVRDLYEGRRATQMLSTLMTVMAIAPLVGPIAGGQILVLFGWRAIFWILGAIGVVTLAALFTLPETLPPERRNREPFAGALMRYGALLRQRRLLGYAGAGGFFYGGIYAYVAGTPFAYITYHHVPPQLYGLLFAIGIIGIMAANLVNARFGDATWKRTIIAFRERCRGARRFGARRDRMDRLGRPLGAGGAAFPVRLGDRFRSSPTRSRAHWLAFRNGPVRSRLWSVPCNTAGALSAPRWSAPFQTGLLGRWVG